MKKTILLLLTFLSINLSAQEYFQQETNYIINVELDDENHTLDGMEQIDYFNNSPEASNNSALRSVSLRKSFYLCSSVFICGCL